MNNRHEEMVALPKSSEVADTWSHDGAMALAKRFQQYWCSGIQGRVQSSERAAFAIGIQ
jgi:hypothetical protein